MAEKILNQTQIVSVASHLCKIIRFRQSECKQCEDICPEKAITLSTGPKISSACSNCGLCLNTCPTEAFYSSIDLEQRLADSMVVSQTAGNHPESITFHCLEAQPLNSSSIGLRCLGNLTEVSLLRAAVSGCKELVFSKGNCAECHLAAGGKLFDTMIETLKPLCKAIGHEQLSFCIIEQQQNADPEKVTLARRKLFTGLIRHVLEVESVPDQTNAKDEVDRKRISAMKAALNEIMSKSGTLASDKLSDMPDVPWKKMVVDSTKCNTCGICVSVCPTGAITKQQTQDQIIAKITQSHCNNCNLCLEACPQQAIDFVKVANLHEAFSEQPVELARLDLTYCVLCGEQIKIANGSEVCTTCKKRQISWPF